MQLIYRGHIYEVTPAAPQAYRQPRALNWRFQTSGETYNNNSAATPVYRQPRALNWRYQMAMDH